LLATVDVVTFITLPVGVALYKVERIAMLSVEMNVEVILYVISNGAVNDNLN